jgi:predicted nucleic acid-binding protein
MPRAIYIETSALLRAILEKGTSAEVEKQILEAQILVTSRLSIVECARALLRARKTDRFSEGVLADQERQLSAFWQQCEVWEVSARVCDLAQAVAPTQNLRTLDALHLATFVLARRRINGLELLTADERLRTAAGTSLDR